MDSDLKKEISRLFNLKQNKEKSEEELQKQATLNLKVREFKSVPLFDNDDEQKVATERFKKYLETNEIESLGDIDVLRSLIYLEVFEIRIQKQLNKLAENDQVPFDKITKQLTDVQNQKLSLKVKLGIDVDEKEDSELTKLQMLEKRFNRWIIDHRNEYSLAYVYTCKKCQHKDIEMVLVRRRVKDFTVMSNPWSAGRFLFNYEILKDVKSKKLTSHDAWRYLCCSSTGGEYEGSFSEEYCDDYIQFCMDNWAKITSHFKK